MQINTFPVQVRGFKCSPSPRPLTWTHRVKSPYVISVYLGNKRNRIGITSIFLVSVSKKPPLYLKLPRVSSKTFDKNSPLKKTCF
jgi:hypothetical protein